MRSAFEVLLELALQTEAVSDGANQRQNRWGLLQPKGETRETTQEIQKCFKEYHPGSLLVR